MDRPSRFVFRTNGVCPAEIHFRIHGGALEDLQFMGGGCPGNATALSRVLQGRRVSQIQGELSDIRCQRGTSCPDQLVQALAAAQGGELLPAPPPRLETDPETRHRVGLIGGLGGNRQLLQDLVGEMRERGVDAIYSLGNLTVGAGRSADLLADLKAGGIRAIAGPDDDLCPSLPSSTGTQSNGLPHLLSFRLGPHQAVAFYGEYLLQLPGFSDFDPFSLEINQVCSLARFMEEENLFPALEAMTGQFQSRIVLFSQRQEWGHWQVGGIDFISVGAAGASAAPSWGLLDLADGNPRFEVQQMAFSEESAHG